MRVLTWNLFHGRSVPPAGRALLREFSDALASWAWDVALLQEVPPWWPEPLARACGAEERHALTSRNLGLPVRRLIAERRPDLIKSNGGGANAILVRGERIAWHHAERVRLWPERRVVHAVRLASGLVVTNMHLSTRDDRAAAELARARVITLTAGDGPAVLGGDLNLTHIPPVGGFEHVAGHRIDHILVRGMAPAGPGEVLDRDTLSDHAPLRVDVIST